MDLGLGELEPTNITLQLVDCSVKIPRGIVKDVLVHVDKFYFPVDFVVLDTQPVVNQGTQFPVILGRPFLATANAIIHCRGGLMTLSFGNMTINLNIFNTEPWKLKTQIPESLSKLMVKALSHSSSISIFKRLVRTW